MISTKAILPETIATQENSGADFGNTEIVTEIVSGAAPEIRTVSERALVSTGVNVSSFERTASFAIGALFAAKAVWPKRESSSAFTEAAYRGAFAVTSFAFIRRSVTGHSRLYTSLGLATREEEFRPLEISSARAVDVPQRTVTVRASLAEIELFFMDPPKLAGFDVGRDLDIAFTFHPVHSTGSTELQGRLLRAPAGTGKEEQEKILRSVLRAAKQLIETGEVATSDARVRGGN